jgi:hypothetical protein
MGLCAHACEWVCVCVCVRMQHVCEWKFMFNTNGYRDNKVKSVNSKSNMSFATRFVCPYGYFPLNSTSMQIALNFLQSQKFGVICRFYCIFANSTKCKHQPNRKPYLSSETKHHRITRFLIDHNKHYRQYPCILWQKWQGQTQMSANTKQKINIKIIIIKLKKI